MKRKILSGTLSVTILAAGLTGFFFSQKGEANAPSPIPAEVQPIVNKMMDSVDHYKFVSATVHFDSESGSDKTAVISAKLEPKVKVKTELADEHGQVVKQFQNNGKLLTVDSKQKTYSEIPISKDAEKAWKDRPAHRFTYMADSKFHVHPRMSPFHVGLGAESLLFPQDFALGVMHRSTNLQVRGHEVLLDREATIIEGTPNEVHLDSFGDHFKIWVDTETGILLKAEFSNNGQMFETQSVTQLELNHPITDAEFEFPSVTEYKKVI